MVMNTIKWLVLIIALLLVTFGMSFFAAFCCVILFLLGLSTMTSLLFRDNCLKRQYPRKKFPEGLFQLPLEETSIFHKYDQRLTGSSVIDDPLQEVLHYVFRDYIRNWYGHISTNEDFLVGVKEVVQKVIVAFSSRSKEVDWVHYLTTKLVDEFASHFRLFRQAQAKLKGLHRKDPTFKSNLLTSFFDLENTMEGNLCRGLACTSSSHELDYLKELFDVLMYVLLPLGDFQNVISRSVVQEIIVNAAVIPLIKIITDPDYINQTIIWLCKDTVPTSDCFLVVLRCADSPSELQAILEILNHEIAIQRSKDTGGDDDADIKQQLSSLFYVRRVTEARLKRLNEGTVDTDSTGMPTGIDWRLLTEPGVKLFSLHFDVVLTNNIALHYFTDFMSSVSAQGYVYFYHSVEGFRVSAEQMLSQATPSPSDLEGIREAAVHIYDLYFAENATLKVWLDESLLKKLRKKIKTEIPCSTWFDEALAKVYEIMQEEPYYPSFKKSQNYIKLLAELDLLKEVNVRTEEENLLYSSPKQSNKFCTDEYSLCDSISLSSLEPDEYILDFLVPESSAIHGRISPAVMSDEVSPEFLELTAQIYNTGIANESGNTYAVYAISVVRRDGNIEEKWCVLRRYSDFRDFHFLLLQKFPHLSTLQFPAKKTFNNLSPQFLEKRTHQLSDYLQCLMNQDILSFNPGLKNLLLQFLEPKVYEQGKKPFAKTVDAIVNPIRSSMKSVSHLVKTVPDSVMDGLKDGFVRAFGKRGSSDGDILHGSSKVAAGLDVEGEDNIPLRILLLLMDEVFDLKSKDQWFRKRIAILLRQIINATYGDTINRKILDFVQKTTSAEQMAEYVKAFRQAMWPNGSLAVPSPEREQNAKLRTKVATKLLMLCSLPDELKHVIGSETTRKGMLYVFEMFQYSELNHRLFYVLLEGILETLFPDNNLLNIFRRLHSRTEQLTLFKWPHTASVDDMTKYNR